MVLYCWDIVYITILRGEYMKRQRIAILMAQADEATQANFLEGCLEECFRNEIDACVFSMYRKYQNSVMREKGESNIYNLINPSVFDAFIIMSDMIQTPGVVDKFEEKLHAEYKGPVLCIDVERPYFPSILTDSYTPTKNLINHLIVDHGYKDIAFLGGKKWHPHTRDRVQAYCDAMFEHGLPISENRLFYGDFWYDSGAVCAEELLSSGEKLPEAIACANDCMAIGMCDYFDNHGIKIPDDIAVVGFDSIEDGRSAKVPITSAPLPSKHNGIQAVKKIMAMMDGRDYVPQPPEPEIIYGNSCGCKTVNPRLGLRDTFMSNEFTENFYSINNNMVEELLSQDNTNGLLEAIYSYKYYIKEYQEIHLCLNDQWATPMLLNKHSLFSTGYSKNMIHAIKASNDDSGKDFVGLDKTFKVTEMLPEIFENSPIPRAFIFTPVHFEGLCFGYFTLVTDKPMGYTEAYRHWITNVANGLECIRRTELFNAMRVSHAAKGAVPRTDKLAGIAKENLTHEDEQNIHVLGDILDNNLFTYHFQPIVKATDGSIYGYEALMRSTSAKPLSPLQILKYAGIVDRLPEIEKASFLNILKIKGDNPDRFEQKKLFINSIPGIQLTTDDMLKIESELQKYSNQVIVELTEQAEMDDHELSRTKDHYKALGIGIAVDDYGTGYSNVTNLLRYMPDCVKIDRSLLSEIQNSPQKQHFVREIIKFSHDNNILALAEGIETTEELHTVILLGADLIQGYYTSRPAAEIIPEIPDGIRKEILSYAKECREGDWKLSYFAGQTNRVPVSSLVKDNYSRIIIGNERAAYKDLTFIGTPGQTAELTIEIDNDYEGRITLDNVHFNCGTAPACISLGENCDVTLSLSGNNELSGGILVPESSKLTLLGDGGLTLNLNSKEYFGIGSSTRHGCIDFCQDGTITINAQGMTGVGIGAPQGGEINIFRGKYIINQNGNNAVGIGAFDADVKLDIKACDLSVKQSVYSGVCIGSVDGNSEVSIEHSLIRITFNANSGVGIGNINGDVCKFNMSNGSCYFEIRADQATGVGSLDGTTIFNGEHMVYHLKGQGVALYAYGGNREDNAINVNDAEIIVAITGQTDTEVVGGAGVYTYRNAKVEIKINDEYLKRF